MLQPRGTSTGRRTPASSMGMPLSAAIAFLGEVQLTSRQRSFHRRSQNPWSAWSAEAWKSADDAGSAYRRWTPFNELLPTPEQSDDPIAVCSGKQIALSFLIEGYVVCHQ